MDLFSRNLKTCHVYVEYVCFNTGLWKVKIQSKQKKYIIQ